jgi:hypothetical protein
MRLSSNAERERLPASGKSRPLAAGRERPVTVVPVHAASAETIARMADLLRDSHFLQITLCILQKSYEKR